MLLLYTIGFLLIVILLQFVPAPFNVPIEKTPTSALTLVWLSAGWVLYLIGFAAFKMVLSYGPPVLMRTPTQAWHLRLQNLERRLRPPILGRLDLMVVGVLLLIFLWLLYRDMPSNQALLAISLAILVYSMSVRANERSAKYAGPVGRLTAEPGPGPRQITLYWQNPADPAFDGVVVRRSIGAPPENANEGDQIYGGFQESACDEGCEPGRIMHYSVFSLSRNGVATRKASIGGVPFPLPSDPLNPRSLAGEREIELHWEFPDEPTLREVVIQRRDDRFPASSEDGERVFRGIQNHFRDPELRPASVYYYRMFSIDMYGQFSPGINVEATTMAPPVGDLRSRLERGAVRLTWANPPGAEPEILIVKKVGSDPESRDDGDQVVVRGNSWTDADVEHQTTYHYGAYSRYHRVVYGGGRFTHITTPPPPAPIQDFAVVPSRLSVELTWRFPISSGFAGVHVRRTRNQAARNAEEGEWVYEGRDRERTPDFGLEPGTDYVYTAFSYDEGGHYNPIGVSIGTRTWPGPRPPNFLPPEVRPQSREVILSWIRVDETAPFVHLRRWVDQRPPTLNYREPGGNLLHGGEGLRYVDRDLLAGHTYYYVAYTVDRDGCPSEGMIHEVKTPTSWVIPVVILDTVANRRVQVSVPESFPLERVLPVVLTRLERGPARNITLHNRTRNLTYRLDSSLLAQGTQAGDELILNYEPEEGHG